MTTMNDDMKRAFGLASEAKAHANGLERDGELNDMQRKHLTQLRRCLEMVERRTDPAADPEYDP